MADTVQSPRVQEVDVVKGIACFLMIAAHLFAEKYLHFGTFAAPLFFACSGMNTILLVEKTVTNRCYDLFHIGFPILLFFGGSTQIAIVHGGHWRIEPEFLQFIALAVLLVFACSKLFKDPRACGYFFPVPFLVQQVLPGSFLHSWAGTPLSFLFGSNFVLFPWLGFVLFGVFILGLKKKLYRGLQLLLFAAVVLSIVVAGLPLKKFRMSGSYIFLALLVITVVFSLGRLIVRQSGTVWAGRVTEFFALPGRNALMFVYVHYFFLRFFSSSKFNPALVVLLLQTFYLFVLCVLLLKFYEKVKDDASLFFPALTMGAVLAGLRWLDLLNRPISLQMADMILGVLFAFLYVQLRRRFARHCGRKK